MTIKFRSDASGGAILNESGVEVLKVDVAGNITFPSGLIKQSKVKRSFFSVFMATNYGIIPTSAWTLVRLWTEILDAAGVFEPTTNGRFQPTVAGWYQINAGVTLTGAAGGVSDAAIWKNGSPHRRIGTLALSVTNVVTATHSGSSAVYLNGAADYVDIRVYTEQASANVLGDAAGELTWMNGYLIEAD
jgi:hypothetical protein